MCAQLAERPDREKKTIFFNVRLEPSLHRKLARLAAKNDRTIAAEMRVAVRRHLEEHTA